MSSRPSSLLAYRDLESYPTLYVSLSFIPNTVFPSLSDTSKTTDLYPLSQDHYVFYYEVLADFYVMRYWSDMVKIWILISSNFMNGHSYRLWQKHRKTSINKTLELVLLCIFRVLL